MYQCIEYMKKNIARSKQFFMRTTPGDLLVFAHGWDIHSEGWKSEYTSNDPIVTLPTIYSREFYKENSFNMGAEMVRMRKVEAEYHWSCLEDDYCPPVCFRPGSGFNTAMHTGDDLVFERGPGLNGTNYIRNYPITDLENYESVFNINNEWMQYSIDFWKGVESCDFEGLTVCPWMGKTPLDLAYGLRGSQIFYDLYDYPELVQELLKKCANSNIDIDRMIRAECSAFKENPGGALGLAFSGQTMLFNGDPLDLISKDMARIFNNSSMELMTQYAEAALLHHHSIGVDRAGLVNEIKGLTLQQMVQDPNGLKLAEAISDEVVQASLHIPILLDLPLADMKGCFDLFMEKIVQGRFIIDFQAESEEEARSYIEKIKRVSKF